MKPVVAAVPAVSRVVASQQLRMGGMYDVTWLQFLQSKNKSPEPQECHIYWRSGVHATKPPN